MISCEGLWQDGKSSFPPLFSSWISGQMEICSFCENVLADVEIWKLRPVLKYLTGLDKYFKAYGQKLGSSFWFYNVHVHTAANYLSLIFRVFHYELLRVQLTKLTATFYDLIWSFKKSINYKQLWKDYKINFTVEKK